MNFETRQTEQSECRASEQNGKRFIEGYALLYNHTSRLIYDRNESFVEIIKPGALDKVLKSKNLDVIASVNHNYEKIIGRTLSSTLKLVNDSKGLKYIIEVPETSYGIDVYESIKRGDIFESSFTFSVNEDGFTWGKASTGTKVRTIFEIKSLREVAPVVWAAYSDTKVTTGNLQKEDPITDGQNSQSGDVDYYVKKLHLIALKYNLEPPKLDTNVDLFEKKLRLLRLK